MVLPITGPNDTSLLTRSPFPSKAGVYTDWREEYVRRFKQAKPFDLPLPYIRRNVQVLGYRMALPGFNQNQFPSYVNVIRWPSSTLQSRAYDKAYDRFKDKLGSAAELAVSLAERKQAFSMMTDRLRQLAAFTLYVKRRQFTKAADVLGLDRRSLRSMNLRKGAKSASNNYLEFHFGWSPLVSDIGNSIEVLQGPPPPISVSAYARSRAKVWEYNPGEWWHLTEGWSDAAFRLAATVRVSNPNLWMANQLGFVNPAKVLWELVPYSFVLDWFVNVSDFLSGYTDFVGLSISDSYITKTWRSKVRFDQYDDYAYWGTGCYVERVVGSIPGPSLKVRAPWRLSPRRGAAAAALLVQRMKSIK